MTAQIPQLCRPRDQLIDIGKLYPQAWKISDEMRAGRGTEYPDWPTWCFLPMGAWHAIVGNQIQRRLDLQAIGDVARLAALGAWRVTQGIYRFDPTLYDAVISTPVAGDVPSDVLYRLPEWCVYLETPGLTWAGSQLYGAWAHLEFDGNTGRTELRFLVDSDLPAMPIVLHLGAWNLADAINRAVDEASRQAGTGPLREVAAALQDVQWLPALLQVIEPLLSLLLYLCSLNAEIGDGQNVPKNPEPKITKRGARLFAPDSPAIWDVGVRLGAALRRAHHAGEIGAGEHAGPRPHIRRAHWHGFRSGAMKGPDGVAIPTEKRKFDLRWLPPIPVNLDDSELPAVIRPVR